MGQLDLQSACDHLIQGHVIAYPTEAVWGLGCDPYNHGAVKRIFAIKQRSPEKGLILVAASMEQLKPLLDPLSESQLKQLRSTWPGPITWLIPDSKKLIPGWIKGSHDSVAVRVSAHPLIRALCTQFENPLVSTSANLSGEPTLREPQELQQKFAGKVDFIVKGELGTGIAPSEIRDLCTGQLIR